MVVKVNVSLPEDVLKKLDEAARQSNSSRSAFLTQAVIHSLGSALRAEHRPDASRYGCRQSLP